MAINVIEDITAHKRAELGQRFLARSAEVLASSLNPDELLVEVANLAVPRWPTGWRSISPPRAAGSTARRSRTPIQMCASGPSR